MCFTPPFVFTMYLQVSVSKLQKLNNSIKLVANGHKNVTQMPDLFIYDFDCKLIMPSTTIT